MTRGGRDALTVGGRARLLGGQYLFGAALVALWLAVTDRVAYPAVIVLVICLAVLAGGALLAVAGWPRLQAWSTHVALASAQVMIATAVAATGNPSTTLLLLFVWTTMYAGLFSRRAASLHLAWTAAMLVAALAAMTTSPARLSGEDAGALLMTLGTVAVASHLVRAITQRLRHDARHDPLTGLANRTLLGERVEEALARRRGGTGGSVMVAIVDLDRFKTVNDSHGHHVGDRLLRALAPRLLAAVRPGDVVARLGGDEFAVLLDDPSGEQDPRETAARLADVWTTPVALTGDAPAHYVSGSIGIAVATAPTDTFETLLRDADAAMYAAKASGPGRALVYDSPMRKGADRRLRLEQDLRRAIDRDELWVAYQPVVNIAARAAHGAEALLRWASPEWGVVSPAEFIPLAEESGLIVSLGRWMLSRVVRDLAGWYRAGDVPATFTVAVNVSPRELDDELPGYLERTLAAAGLPLGCLALEITEGALLAPDKAGPILHRLHEQGTTLLLDDFGTGFSSLSHLQQFPFDVLKIDRSFIQRIDRPDACSIVEAITAMARALGLDVVAEGVETLEQAQAAWLAGCEQAQGYLYAPGVPAHQLAATLISLLPATPTRELQRTA